MAVSQPSVCIVMVLYNNRSDLSECLESIFKDPAGQNATWVFIDNASTDNSIEKIYACPFFTEKNSRIIRNKKNLGFAGAVNQGLEIGQKNFSSDYLFILNPDTILKKNSLLNLLMGAEEKGLALASPLIKDFCEKVWFEGGKISWWRMKTLHKKNRLDYLTGCALLVRNEVIPTIGRFDERFFLYHEDADFSLRAKKAGFKIGLVKNSQVWHKESSSSNSRQKNYFLVLSGLLFFEKHSGLLRKYLWFWPIFWLRWFFHRFLSGKKEVFHALEDFHKKNRSPQSDSN